MIEIKELVNKVNVDVPRDYDLFKVLDDGQRLVRKKTHSIRRNNSVIGYKYGIFVVDGRQHIHVIDRIGFKEEFLKSQEFDTGLAEIVGLLKCINDYTVVLRHIQDDKIKRLKRQLASLGYYVSLQDVKLMYCEATFHLNNTFDIRCIARYGNNPRLFIERNVLY